MNCSKFIYISAISDPTVKELQDRNGFLWIEESSEHFNYYFEKDSYASDYISSIIEISENSYKRVLQLLGIQSYDERIYMFIVDSRNRMKELIGSETNARCFPYRHITTHVYSEDIKAIGAHEMMHDISWNIWGKPERWISEGLAVYSDDRWHRNSLHELSHYKDFKDFNISEPELCVFNIPLSGEKNFTDWNVWYFRFKIDLNLKNLEYNKINKYTELKAYTITGLILGLYGLIVFIALNKIYPLEEDENGANRMP